MEDQWVKISTLSTEMSSDDFTHKISLHSIATSCSRAPTYYVYAVWRRMKCDIDWQNKAFVQWVYLVQQTLELGSKHTIKKLQRNESCDTDDWIRGWLSRFSRCHFSSFFLNGATILFSIQQHFCWSWPRFGFLTTEHLAALDRSNIHTALKIWFSRIRSSPVHTIVWKHTLMSISIWWEPWNSMKFILQLP